MVDSDNVQVAVSGDVFVAPLGTTLPTSATESLNAAFEALGYLDDTGIAEAQSRTINSIKAFQNAAVVRKITSEHDATYSFVALETNPVVLETYYGNYTDGPDGPDGVVEVDGADLPHLAAVIDIYDGDDTIRHVLGSAQVTEQGQTNYGSADAIKRPMTVTAYPSDAISDNKAIIYFNTMGAS